MKCLLLSIILASAQGICLGSANDNLQIVLEDTDDSEVVDRSVTTIAAADPHNPLSRLIKISTNEQSLLRYDIAYIKPETTMLDDAKHRVIACLIADANLQGDQPAQRLLEMLAPLQLRACSAPTDQYSRIKDIVSASSELACNKWTVIFVLERLHPGMVGGGIHVYMRILRETTQHNNLLRKALYCKLPGTGKATLRYDESGMSEEVWKDLDGLASDELGIEIDHAELCKQLPPPGCILL